MKARTFRIATMCALLLGFAAAQALAEDALGCADYISSGLGEDPLTGFLIGTETQSTTLTFSARLEPGGIGGSTSGSTTVTWEVGYYRMSDGSFFRIDCRNYTKA